jgi:hypothetical protein
LSRTGEIGWVVPFFHVVVAVAGAYREPEAVFLSCGQAFMGSLDESVKGCHLKSSGRGDSKNFAHMFLRLVVMLWGGNYSLASAALEPELGNETAEG